MSGVAVLLLLIPFQGLMGRLFQSVRRKTAQLTDHRIRIMNEIITGMRVIKMYTWEKAFAELVALARK
jgi:ATP-binding cassette subfamily C (CFTR/MRP) protein 4